MKSIIQPILFLIVVLILSTPASAAFIIVNTFDNEDNEDGDCSLREAVRSANQNLSFDNCSAGGSVGTDDIFIGQTGTIVLPLGLEIIEQVNIFGPGMDALTLDAQGLGQHFSVNMLDQNDDFDLSLVTLANGFVDIPGGSVWLQSGGDFTFEDVRFLDNTSTGSLGTSMNLDGFGGAIAVSLPPGSQSSLTIRRCQFDTNSSSGDGGAIGTSLFGSLDSLVVEASRFINNSADSGGAIYGFSLGSISIEQSVFEGNEADSGDGNAGSAKGGALSLRPEDTSFSRISGATFFNNSAYGPGGAIYVEQGPTLIVNSTFTNNISSTGRGNAIDFSANVGTIMHSTLISNDNPDRTTDSAIESRGGASVSLSHSIVYTEGLDHEAECQTVTGGSTFTSLGYNIDTSGTCTGHATDLPMTDPELAPLGDYGDDSASLILQTFLPKTGSPAIEGGQLGPCDGGLSSGLTKDQRGQARPNFLRCDIGAVEYQFANDPDAFNLIVEIGSGAGTVTSNPDGIDCTGTCVENFLEGTQVALSATPAPGFEFSGWTDDCSGTGPCQVTMTTGRRVVANFVPSGFSLETLIDGNSPGSIISLPEGIDCPGDCTETYPEDTVVSLTPMAHAGGRFLHWAGDCTGSSACNVTMAGMRRVIGVFADADTIFIDGYE